MYICTYTYLTICAYRQVAARQAGPAPGSVQALWPGKAPTSPVARRRLFRLPYPYPARPNALVSLPGAANGTGARPPRNRPGALPSPPRAGTPYLGCGLFAPRWGGGSFLAALAEIQPRWLVSYQPPSRYTIVYPYV